MKKWIGSISFVSVLLAFTACKPDAPLQYNAPDGIYFNAASDSMYYTFAKYPNRLVDTVKIPVAVLGKPAAQDREITLAALSDAEVNAVEGTHYKLLPPYKIPAGSTKALLPMVVYRSGDLDSILATLKLQLKANSSFETGITAKTSIKIKVAFLQKPPAWGDLNGLPWAGWKDNFGTWTKTKYKLILDALYDPVSDTTISEFPSINHSVGQYPAAYNQYLQIVKNYIRTKYPGNFTPFLGNYLKDPDVPGNPYVTVGTGTY